MAIILSIKSTILGLLLAIAFSSFILCIIYTNLQIVYTSTGYSPYMIAFLVAAALQMLFNVILFASSKRNKIFSAMNIIGVQTLFALWYLGVAIAITARRYTKHLCPAGPDRTASSCLGITKALMAMAWIDFIITSIYIALVFVSATTYGTLSSPDGDLLPEEELEIRNAREKSAAH